MLNEEQIKENGCDIVEDEKYGYVVDDLSKTLKLNGRTKICSWYRSLNDFYAKAQLQPTIGPNQIIPTSEMDIQAYIDRGGGPFYETLCSYRNDSPEFYKCINSLGINDYSDCKVAVDSEEMKKLSIVEEISQDDIEKIEDSQVEVLINPLTIVYSTALDSKDNKKLIRAYFDAVEREYDDRGFCEVERTNFINYHRRDLIQCLGGQESFIEFVKNECNLDQDSIDWIFDESRDTPSEIIEKVKSVLGENISEEQIQSIAEELFSSERRELKIEVTSDPRYFGDNAKEKHTSDYGSKYGEERFCKNVRTILGDVKTGYLKHSEYHRNENISIVEERYEETDFSMSKPQVVIAYEDYKDTLRDEIVYEYETKVMVYIPDEKNLEYRKPMTEKEADKIKRLKQSKEDISSRGNIKREGGNLSHEDFIKYNKERATEINDSLNSLMEKLNKRPSFESYRDLAIADTKLELAEQIKSKTNGTIGNLEISEIVKGIVAQDQEKILYKIPEINITSDPEKFAVHARNEKTDFQYHDNHDKSESVASCVYGDVVIGDYDEYQYNDGRNLYPEEVDEELPDFSMNQIQVVINDIMENNGDNQYREIDIYIPEQREYPITSYKKNKQLQKGEISTDDTSHEEI